PALVVAPAAADLQVARREALPREAARPGERERRRVGGLDVGLQTVQLQRAERVAHGRAQSFAHQTLSLEPGERVVAEVRAAECAKNDLREVDDSYQCTGLALTDQKPQGCPASRALYIRAELPWRGRCEYPRSMKRTACQHRSQEIPLIGRFNAADADSRAPGRTFRTFKRCPVDVHQPARCVRRLPLACAIGRSLRDKTLPDSDIKQQPFRLRRYFSLTSGVAVLVVTLVMSLAYRSTERNEHIELAESRNVTLARIFANSIWPEFSTYLAREAASAQDQQHPQTARLHDALRRMSRGLPVIKIKIYNPHGTAVYSSVQSEIGEDKSTNPA